MMGFSGAASGFLWSHHFEIGDPGGDDWLFVNLISMGWSTMSEVDWRCTGYLEHQVDEEMSEGLEHDLRRTLEFVEEKWSCIDRIARFLIDKFNREGDNWTRLDELPFVPQQVTLVIMLADGYTLDDVIPQADNGWPTETPS